MPTVGFDGTITEAQWSAMQLRAAEIAYRHGVWSGGAVTPGTGRAVNVAALDVWIAGIWHTTTAPTSVTVTANAGTNRRIDYIVAEADWTANTVTLKPVAGVAAATPTAPALTQNAGVLWQMPLARVTVAGNATTFTAANIEACGPLPRAARKVTTADIGAFSFGPNASGRIVSTGTVTDPGWPYWLDIDAAMLFSGDSGAARLDVTLDGTGTSGVDQSGAMTTSSGDVTARASRFIGPLTGAHAVALTVSSSGVTAGAPFATTGGAANYFIVRQIPA